MKSKRRQVPQLSTGVGASARLVAAWAIIALALPAGTFPVTSSAAALAAQSAAPPRAGDTLTGDLPPEEQAAADEESETTIRAICLTCHPVENVVRSRRVPADWNTVIARMANLGARASDEQFRMIRRYLIRYYGTVRVNSAPAEEFSAVLGYSPKDATAIVSYRQAHGSFADIDALAKVPGLDRTKLDEQPEALKFE